MTNWSKPPRSICHLSSVICGWAFRVHQPHPAEKLATNSTAQPSRNQIKKPITSTCTSTTTCTYFVDVDMHVLVDACCHLQICFQKVKDFRPSNTNYSKEFRGSTEL